MKPGHPPISPEDLDALLHPLQLAGVTVPNRVMTSALTLQYGERGLISDRHLAFYRERAEGGVGLLFSEQLTASPISGSPFSSEINAYDERQVERFAALARALEPYPTRFFAQLFSGGASAVSTGGLDRWGPVRGPSRRGVPGGESPLPLTSGELQSLAADYAGSAANVQAGGLDGVEVHGAHGWLVGQFLSPFYNRRRDEYGGSVTNRCRLAVDIGAAIRAEVGPDFPLGITLSYDELIGDAGITPEDTLAQLEVLLAAGIYDFYDLSIGAPHSVHHTIASMAVREGVPLEFAARAKALVGDRAAVLVAGRIVSLAMAAEAVRTDAADMVAMSRAHLADPSLMRKARSGRATEITSCVGANVCVRRAKMGEPVACVLTPATGREAFMRHGDYQRVPSGDARRVLIAGAGPAGLRAATVAAQRGHEVIIHERAKEPGGHLAALARLPTREEWAKAIASLVDGLARHGAELHCASEVDVAAIEAEAPDAVVVATGAIWDTSGASARLPSRTELPVAGGGRILGLDKALRLAATAPADFGERVVLLDETGTYAPLGLAEVLATRGVGVHFVTPNAEIGHEAAKHLELPHVMPRLRARGVECIAGHLVEGVNGGEVVLADVWGGTGRTIEGVTAVVLASGRVPRDQLYTELHGLHPCVHRIGDALAPRSTAAVIYEAERLALEL